MSGKTAPVQVVGLGQACVDYLGRIPFYPDEDRKVELKDLYVRCGGPASTAMITLSRLGVSAAFLGSLSDDLFGTKIMETLQNEKVDLRCLTVRPGFTSQFAFIAVSDDGRSRTIFWHRGSVPHLRAEEVDLRPFAGARIVLLDGLMVAASVAAADQARKMGMRVVMDGGTMREGTRELLMSVDVLIASETFATPLVGDGAPPEQTLEVLRKLGPREVVITLGSRGSAGLNDRGPVRQPAFPIRAVDTTGAGDVYHGGYIYGLLHGWDMLACMRFASAAAALKCRQIGAQTAIPDLDTINAFLRDVQAKPLP